MRRAEGYQRLSLLAGGLWLAAEEHRQIGFARAVMLHTLAIRQPDARVQAHLRGKGLNTAVFPIPASPVTRTTCLPP